MSSADRISQEIILPRSGALLTLPALNYKINDAEFQLVPDIDRLGRVLEMVNFMNGSQFVTPLRAINCQYDDGFSVELIEKRNARRHLSSAQDNHHLLYLNIGTTQRSGEYTTEQLAAIQEVKINESLKSGLAQYATKGEHNRSARNRLVAGNWIGSSVSTGVGVAVAYEISPVAGVVTATVGAVGTFVGLVISGAYSENRRRQKIQKRLEAGRNFELDSRHQEDLFSVPLLSLVRTT